MNRRHSRRDFLAGAGAFVGASLVHGTSLAHAAESRAKIKFGYAAITWQQDDRKAIEDIASAGFPGIQLRASALKVFPEPAQLRDALKQHKLTLVALSSGTIRADSPDPAADIETHVRNAKYLRDAGGLYLQLLDQRPKRESTKDDYKALGRQLNEIGKRAGDLGIKLGYHNHMGSLGQAPEEVDRVMDSTDPRWVKLELDIAHYLQGGGDPVKPIHAYKNRILFMHIKDVESITPATPQGRNYRFMELGRGRVDIPAVFKALDQISFNGWAVVELDAVPDAARSPKESALISKTYLQRLGFTI